MYDYFWVANERQPVLYISLATAENYYDLWQCFSCDVAFICRFATGAS